VCAGNIISELSKIKNQPELTDAGLASLLLYERHENNILAMLKNSEHGKLLIENGFNPKREWNRGFDHGTFVPLMLAFPDAEIPVVQLSLLNSLDAAAHIKLGQALESLRSEGVLIIGSGMSFHNMSAFMSGNIIDAEKSNIFDETLTKIVSDLNIESRNDKLIHWKNIPGALDCHPRSEHLTPLFVIAGAAGNDIGRTDFSGKIMGFNVSAFAFG